MSPTGYSGTSMGCNAGSCTSSRMLRSANRRNIPLIRRFWRNTGKRCSYVNQSHHRYRRARHGKRALFQVAQAGSGFVEQQHRWLAGQCACNLDHALLAQRQRCGGRVRMRGKLGRLGRRGLDAIRRRRRDFRRLFLVHEQMRVSEFRRL